MGLFLWTLAAGIGYAGYRGYRKLQIIEEDLRQKVASESLPEEKVLTACEVEENPVIEVVETEPAELPTNLEKRILQRVKEQPGMLQTELYGLFPGDNRRRLQEHLKNMDQAGILKRVKEGGTYKLHPG